MSSFSEDSPISSALPFDSFALDLLTPSQDETATQYSLSLPSAPPDLDLTNLISRNCNDQESFPQEHSDGSDSDSDLDDKQCHPSHNKDITCSSDTEDDKIEEEYADMFLAPLQMKPKISQDSSNKENTQPMSQPCFKLDGTDISNISTSSQAYSAAETSKAAGDSLVVENSKDRGNDECVKANVFHEKVSVPDLVEMGKNDRKENECFRGKRARDVMERWPLSECSNVISEDEQGVNKGKWRCPKNAKKYFGPPSRQLSLLSWLAPTPQ